MKNKTSLIIAIILSLNILIPVILIESAVPLSSCIIQVEPEKVLTEESVPEEVVPEEVVRKEYIPEEIVSEVIPEEEEEEVIYVYRTRTGKRYHRAECRSLYNSMIEVELNSAKNKYGLTPCLVCRPPE